MSIFDLKEMAAFSFANIGGLVISMNPEDDCFIFRLENEESNRFTFTKIY